MTKNPHKTDSAGFSLLEVLVASAVLALLMAFTLGMVQQTVASWEMASRKLEGSQAARLALDRIVQDLENAFVASNLVRGGTNLVFSNASTATNLANFLHLDNASSIPGGNPSGMSATLGSDQIFAFTTTGASAVSDSPWVEAGYIPVFTAPNAASTWTMARGRYYLTRHAPPLESGNQPATNSEGSVMFSNSLPLTNATGGAATNWINNTRFETFNRVPIVDNCIHFDVKFVGPNGQTNDTWNNRTELPPSGLITMVVLNDRAAARLAQIRPNGLSATEMSLATNLSLPNTNDAVQNTLREGREILTRTFQFRNAR
jgi:prepilin-type N-terminal cleavage/methylation domain-containing protein